MGSAHPSRVTPHDLPYTTHLLTTQPDIQQLHCILPDDSCPPSDLHCPYGVRQDTYTHHPTIAHSACDSGLSQSGARLPHDTRTLASPSCPPISRSHRSLCRSFRTAPESCLPYLK